MRKQRIKQAYLPAPALTAYIVYRHRSLRPAHRVLAEYYFIFAPVCTHIFVKTDYYFHILAYCIGLVAAHLNYRLLFKNAERARHYKH